MSGLKGLPCLPTSPWNVQVAPDAPRANTSTAYSLNLHKQTRIYPAGQNDPDMVVTGPYGPGQTLNINKDQYTFPIYHTALNTTRVKVTLVETAKVDGHRVPRAPGANSNLQDYWLEVPMPTKSLCKPGTNRPDSADGQVGSEGTDESAIIVCGNEAWEFYKIIWDDEFGWTAVYGAYIPNIYAHIGFFPTWGVKASGCMSLAGIITNEDCAKGSIDHGLYMAIPCSGNGATNVPPKFIAPCKRGDKLNIDLVGTTAQLDAIRLPHGCHFVIDPTLDVDEYVASKAGIVGVDPVSLRALFLCLQNYGAWVSDSARGVVQFSVEDSRTYGTPYSDYTSRPTGLGTLTRTTVVNLPWDRFQQVATVDPLNEKVLAYLDDEPTLMSYHID